MGWQDRLREAAYTPPMTKLRLPFTYEDVRYKVRKRTSAFEFPDADGTYIQELGVGGRRYPMKIIFWGDDYDLEAATFEAALIEPGIGKLEHPIYGTVDVVPFGEITREDRLKSSGNQTTISLTFFETTGLVYPTAGTSPAGAVLDGQVHISVSNLGGAHADSDGDLIIARVEFECEAIGDVFVTVSTTPSFATWAPFPWLDDDMEGKPKYDYDNQQFLLDLVRHLCPAKQGETNLILIDESRHIEPGHLLKPIYGVMEVTGYLTSSPYYAYPIIVEIGFLMIFTALLVKDKESWAHRFDISVLSPRKQMPSDISLQTIKLRLSTREKIRLKRGLSPEEFSSLNESTIMATLKDPELIELVQNKDRTYSAQEIKRLMDKIKKIQAI